MQEEYRRAYKKMKGESMIHHRQSMDRRALLQNLGHNVDPSLSIILREVLDLQEGATPEQLSSFAPEQRNKTVEQLEAFKDDLKFKFDEFIQKWEQRLTNTDVLAILERGNWIDEDGTFLKLGLKGSKKEFKEFFYQMGHIMVGDAEKLLVMVQSRCGHIQEKSIKSWYQTIDTPQSRLLPTLEAALRPWENDVFRKVRNSIYPMALEYFQFGIKTNSKKLYTTKEELLTGFGAHWDQHSSFDNGMLGYLHTFAELAHGLCIQIVDWFIQKIGLFFRGFRGGQLDLFHSKD